MYQNSQERRVFVDFYGFIIFRLSVEQVLQHIEFLSRIVHRNITTIWILCRENILSMVYDTFSPFRAHKFTPHVRT